jgi:hypothetical protein
MTKETYILLNNFCIAIYDKPLAYVENQGYFLYSGVGGQVELTNFENTETLYPASVKNFPKYFVLNNQKDLSQLCRNTTATLPQHYRNGVASVSEHAPELTKSQIALAEKYNLVDFSAKLVGTQKQDAEITYRLIILALERAFLQKKSKTKIIETFFNPAQKAVQEKNFLELENIKEDCSKLLGMQNRAIESRHVQKAKIELWSKLKKRLYLLSVAILVAASAITLHFVISTVNEGYEVHTANITAKQNSLKVFTVAEITHFINEYQKELGKPIYEWRRSLIFDEVQGVQLSENELKEIIKKLGEY